MKVSSQAMPNVTTLLFVLVLFSVSVISVETIGKKLSDYNDADLERLLDQWNENDEDFEEEEGDDPRKKPPPKVNMENIFKAGGNKELILKASKKGQPLMMFINLAGTPKRSDTETISSFWQSSLQNNNIQVQRYVIADDRVLFQLHDGSLAFEIRDFLVTQDTCKTVSFEQLEFPCKKKKEEL